MTEARRRQGPWLGNLAPCTLGQLEAIVRNWLQRIQRQPALINGFLLFTIARPSGLAYAGMSFTRRNAQSTISTQPPPDPRPATR